MCCVISAIGLRARVVGGRFPACGRSPLIRTRRPVGVSPARSVNSSMLLIRVVLPELCRPDDADDVAHVQIETPDGVREPVAALAAEDGNLTDRNRVAAASPFVRMRLSCALVEPKSRRAKRRPGHISLNIKRFPSVKENFRRKGR